MRFETTVRLVLTVCLALASSAVVVAGTADLLISEVLEGTPGNSKFVELFNSGAGAANLVADDVAVRQYNNGSTTPTYTFLFSSVGAASVAAGDFYVIANNSVDHETNIGFPAADLYVTFATNATFSFNGNDPLQLISAASTTPVVIDGFGVDVADGTSTSFHTDRVAHRISAQLPNNGNWGSHTVPADGGDSPTGFWRVGSIGSYADSFAKGTPGAAGGSGGTEVPVELISFSIQ